MPVEPRGLGEHRRPEFLRSDPAGEVPVLVDGDSVISGRSKRLSFFIWPRSDTRRQGLNCPLTSRSGRRLHHRWVLFAIDRVSKAAPAGAERQAIPSCFRGRRACRKDVALAAGSDFAAMARVLERHMDGRRFIDRRPRHAVADCVAAYLMDWAR